MHNKKTNSYDEAKKMLNTLRNLRYKTNIHNRVNEQDEEIYNNEKNDIAVVDDAVDVNINSSDKSDLKLNVDEKNQINELIDNFKIDVSQVVDFDPGFTINQKQIRLDGNLTVADSDDGINFVLIAGNQRGLYINGDMLKIDSEKLELLSKLQSFYEDKFVAILEQMINKRNNNFPTKED
jgi:hypothetical protein